MNSKYFIYVGLLVSGISQEPVEIRYMKNLYFTILTALRYTLQAFNNITIDKMHLCNKHDILLKIVFKLTFMDIPTQAK